jgi:ribosomal protein S18 acetylase RimI-like enzyme
VIELRVLSPDDWLAWRELRLAALAEAPYAFSSRLADWQGDGDRAERWRARLDGSFNVLAMLNRQPAGMASGARTDDGVADLLSLWVSPAARGRGVADELVGAVERWARQAQAGLLRLAVMVDNENAVALYERNGFHRTIDRDDMTLGRGRREYTMTKALTATS